jgi:hypothetical protein
MEKMWLRAVLTLAMTMSLSACAKKKDSAPVAENAKNTAPAPAPIPTDADGKAKVPPPTTPGPAGTSKDSQKPPKPGQVPGQKDAPPKGASSKPDKDKSGHGHGSGNGNGSGSGNGNSDGGDTAQPVPPSSSAPSTPPNAGSDLPPAPAPAAPVSEMDELIAQATQYSGAAEDSLRQILMERMEQTQDSAQRLRDLRLANSISNVTLKFNTVMNRYEAKIITGNGAQEIGLISERTGVASSPMISNTSGVKASIKCADDVAYDAGAFCETSVISMKYKHAKTKIIFRHTNVQLHGTFPERKCLTKPCDDFYLMLRLSGLNVINPLTLKFSVMDSFEVMWGKSGFKLLGGTNSGEVFKVAGPLANPILYPVLDTATDRVLSHEDLIDPATQQLRKTQINETMGDVRIVQNSGRGDVNLLVKMQMMSDGDRDAFQVTLKRIIKPVRALVED